MVKLKIGFVSFILLFSIINWGFAEGGRFVYFGGRQIALKAIQKPVTISGDKGHLLVQFTRPIGEKEKIQLDKLGVILHQYIPENAYFATIKQDNLDAMKSVDFVYGVGNWRDAKLYAGYDWIRFSNRD